jgi:hypothetical protein
MCAIDMLQVLHNKLIRIKVKKYLYNCILGNTLLIDALQFLKIYSFNLIKMCECVVRIQ